MPYVRNGCQISVVIDVNCPAVSSMAEMNIICLTPILTRRVLTNGANKPTTSRFVDPIKAVNKATNLCSQIGLPAVHGLTLFHKTLLFLKLHYCLN